MNENENTNSYEQRSSIIYVKRVFTKHVKAVNTEKCGIALTTWKNVQRGMRKANITYNL